MGENATINDAGLNFTVFLDSTDRGKSRFLAEKSLNVLYRTHVSSLGRDYVAVHRAKVVSSLVGPMGAS